MAKKLGNYVQDLRLAKNFHQELRFILLVKKYGGNGVYAVLLLWNWVAENHPSTGRLEKVKGEHIHALCCISEEQSEEFINDLIEFEFLAKDESGVFFIPDWREEQPHVAEAEERSEAARAAVRKRWDKRNTASSEKTDAKPTTSSNTSVVRLNYSNTNSNTNLKFPLTPQGGGEEGKAPVKKIVELYREVLPELPEPEEITEKISRDIERRWAAKGERRNLDYWRRYFERVRACPHLMGEGREGWRASLGWLVGRGNMDKVLGGEYPTRQEGVAAAGGMSQEEFERLCLSDEDEAPG